MFLCRLFAVLLSLYSVKCLPAGRVDEWDNVGQPIDYNLQTPATPFIGRESELSEISLMHNDKKFIVISGLRGVGKSELARKYAEQFKKEHVGSVIWIKSDTLTEMVDELKNLASQIGLSQEGKKITQIVREVFHFFKNRSALFVFDNASSDNVLLKYLKQLIINENKTKILITSRDEDFDRSQFTSIYLNNFTTSEAVKYIKIVLKDVDIPTDETTCEELANALVNLPLALHKSTEYIIKQNAKGKYTIQDFIREMKSQGVTTTTPIPLNPVDEEIEKDLMEKIKEETERVGDKIASGANQAWEKVSGGATHVGHQIAYGAKEAGKGISNAAKTVGHEVKKFFSGFG